MALPDRTTILIVGAGPAGLAAAISIFYHGIRDLVIVDALSQGENVSRAIFIHAATLEALDTIGCGRDIVSQGIKDTTSHLRTRSRKLISPCIESLTAYTRHPYVLIIPQNLTERILEKKLRRCGVIVHRPVKMVGLRPNTSNPRLSDVTFEDGRVITTKYVIGADGARSVVRSSAGIGFSDPTNGQGEANNILTQSVTADVTFDTPDAHQSALSGTLSPNNFFVCFPLPSAFNESLVANGQAAISERVYRIACGVPLETGGIPRSPSKEYLQDLVDRFGPLPLASNPAVNPNSKPTRIKDVVWSSRFRDHTAIADAMFTRLYSGESGKGGAILLVGDAAHVHSSVGGQGMNLGLRDAIFLGGALRNHIRTTERRPLCEADWILREFSVERRARALEVIGLTQRVLSIVGMSYRERLAWWCPVSSETARSGVLWLLGCIPIVRKMIAWELSGLSRR